MALSILSQVDLYTLLGGQFYNAAQDPSNPDIIYGMQPIADNGGFNFIRLTFTFGLDVGVEILGYIPYVLSSENMADGIRYCQGNYGEIIGNYYCFMTEVGSNFGMTIITIDPYSFSTTRSSADNGDSKPVITDTGSGYYMSFIHWMPNSMRFDSKLCGSGHSITSNSIAPAGLNPIDGRIICKNQDHSRFLVRSGGYRWYYGGATPSVGNAIADLPTPDADYILNFGGELAHAPYEIPNGWIEEGDKRYFMAKGVKTDGNLARYYWYCIDTSDMSCSWVELPDFRTTGGTGGAYMFQAIASAQDSSSQRVYYSHGQSNTTKATLYAAGRRDLTTQDTLTGFNTNSGSNCPAIHHIFATRKEILVFHRGGSTPLDNDAVTRVGDGLLQYGFPHSYGTIIG